MTDTDKAQLASLIDNRHIWEAMRRRNNMPYDDAAWEEWIINKVHRNDAWIMRLHLKLAKARNALKEIAEQKKSNELETEHDFEAGFNMCVDRARAALNELAGKEIMND